MQKIAKKFVEVMKDCSHVAKNGTNDFHRYKKQKVAPKKHDLKLYSIQSIFPFRLVSLTFQVIKD